MPEGQVRLDCTVQSFGNTPFGRYRLAALGVRLLDTTNCTPRALGTRLAFMSRHEFPPRRSRGQGVCHGLTQAALRFGIMRFLETINVVKVHPIAVQNG